MMSVIGVDTDAELRWAVEQVYHMHTPLHHLVSALHTIRTTHAQHIFPHNAPSFAQHQVAQAAARPHQWGALVLLVPHHPMGVWCSGAYGAVGGMVQWGTMHVYTSHCSFL